MKNLASALLFFISLSTGFSQSNNDIQNRLNSFKDSLTQLLGTNEPSASILITHHNKIVFEEYFGLVHVEKNERLTSAQVLGIASMSKQFVGMSILFLAEEGKLTLDDDISIYFPDLPLGNRKINIKQLLSHTSGLPELTQNEYFMNTIDSARHVNEIINLVMQDEFRHEPGEKYMYCNTGFTMAVSIIEKVSGLSFGTFLSEKIFIPLQMNQTYTGDFEHDDTNAIQRYLNTSSGYSPANEMHFSNLIGGGGIVSNAQDMTKWNRALLSGENLPSNYKKLWEPTPLNCGDSINYGLGIGISDYNGNLFYYHPGMGDGMNSINLIFPEQEFTITVLRNVSKPKFSSKQIALLASEYLFPNSIASNE